MTNYTLQKSHSYLPIEITRACRCVGLLLLSLWAECIFMIKYNGVFPVEVSCKHHSDQGITHREGSGIWICNLCKAPVSERPVCNKHPEQGFRKQEDEFDPKWICTVCEREERNTCVHTVTSVRQDDSIRALVCNSCNLVISESEQDTNLQDDVTTEDYGTESQAEPEEMKSVGCKPRTPLFAYLLKYAVDLSVKWNVLTKANAIVRDSDCKNHHGKTIAAAAVYLALKDSGDMKTFTDVSRVTGVGAVTISICSKEMEIKLPYLDATAQYTT